MFKRVRYVTTSVVIGVGCGLLISKHLDKNIVNNTKSFGKTIGKEAKRLCKEVANTMVTLKGELLKINKPSETSTSETSASETVYTQLVGRGFSTIDDEYENEGIDDSYDFDEYEIDNSYDFDEYENEEIDDSYTYDEYRDEYIEKLDDEFE